MLHPLTSFREAQTPKLTQEDCAKALGLSASSKSWIADIENSRRKASLKLALKIEKWSGGQVPAASLCDFVTEVEKQGAAG